MIKKFLEAAKNPSLEHQFQTNRQEGQTDGHRLELTKLREF